MLPAPNSHGTLRTRPVIAQLAIALACLFVANSAQAIPYFTETCGSNSNCGFDNDALGLTVTEVIPAGADFTTYPIDSEVPPDANDMGLIAEDEINDTLTMIDRTVTWTLVNNAPAELDDFIVIFTLLAAFPTGYENANIDLKIDEFDPMRIVESQGSYFAGYRLDSSDFTMVNGRLEATRVFRYTVNLPEGDDGPPRLGIALTKDVFSVPEPATGLLLSGALLLVAGAGRKRLE